MRLAFVDLEFAWPPPGGAQYDAVHTMSGLARAGHEVHLFCRRDPGVWRFSGVDRETFDLPYTEIEIASGDAEIETVCSRFRDAVEAWRPDAVFLCFCFFIRPYLAEALSKYPIIDRFYTYEHLCPKDFSLFKREGTCRYDYVNAPNACRRCFAWAWRWGLLLDRMSPFAQSFLDAGGFTQEYYDRYVRHLETAGAVIVYNEMAKGRIAHLNPRVFVVSGGVHTDQFRYTPAPEKRNGEKKVIFMAGRADDYLKGADTLIYACDILAADRDDFELWITQTDPRRPRPWLRNLGWRPQREVAALYEQSDICVVPSVWDEPFGMVAAEAMASGRPVCASRAGGLQHIVEHGTTGFVFERKSHLELAVYLSRLLDDARLRRSMGDAGRARAEARYDWSRVIDTYYPAIFEAALR